jgi:phage shock protein A
MMTQQEVDEASDRMLGLIQRATLALKAGKPAVAAELLKQVHAVAKSLQAGRPPS